MARALYFGCIDGGHYLHSDTKICNRSIHPQRDYPGFPWDVKLLDTGLLLNGKVPDRPDGAVRWTCGGKARWYAFFWWDRSGDSRPNSNSGFYVRGFNLKDHVEAFEFACAAWPKIVERQAFTLRLVA